MVKLRLKKGRQRQYKKIFKNNKENTIENMKKQKS